MSGTALASRRPATVLAGAVALGLGLSLAAAPTAHAETVTPVANPDLASNICGLDVVLAIDASNSIKAGGGATKVNQLKQTAVKIVDSFADKNTRLSVITFSADAQVLTPLTAVTTQSAAVTGSIGSKIMGYKSGQGTNWEAALNKTTSVMQGARAGVGKLVLFISDGRPNKYLDDNGNVTPASNAPVGNVVRAKAVDEGTISANTLKSATGSHVLAIGIGDALDPDNTAYVAALKQISGTDTVQGNATPNVRTADVILQSNLTSLSNQLSTVASQAINNANCSFLSVRPSPGVVKYKKRGSAVALTATLASPGGAIGGQNVTLYARQGSDWASLGTKTTNSAGQAAWSTTVKANQQFFARFAGSGSTHSATDSGAVSVLVAPKVKTNLSKSSLGRASALLTFSGKIKPKTVKKIFLQRKDQGAWTNIAKKKAQNGKFAISQIVTKKKSKWRIATKKNASYTSGTSKVFKVKV